MLFMFVSNLLWLSGAIWLQTLNWQQNIIWTSVDFSSVWYPSSSKFAGSVQASMLKNEFEKYTIKITAMPPRG